MLLLEALLQRMELSILEKSFDGKELGSVSLHGKHRARLDRLSVENDGASAAIAGIAADVRAGEPQHLPDEMNQEQPGFDIGLSLTAIDLDVNRLLLCHRLPPIAANLYLLAGTLTRAR